MVPRKTSIGIRGTLFRGVVSISTCTGAASLTSRLWPRGPIQRGPTIACTTWLEPRTWLTVEPDAAASGRLVNMLVRPGQALARLLAHRQDVHVRGVAAERGAKSCVMLGPDAIRQRRQCVLCQSRHLGESFC